MECNADAPRWYVAWRDGAIYDVFAMPPGSGHAAALDEAERRHGPKTIAIYLGTRPDQPTDEFVRGALEPGPNDWRLPG